MSIETVGKRPPRAGERPVGVTDPPLHSDERALRGLFLLCVILAVGGTFVLSEMAGPDWLPALWASLCIGFYGFASYRRAPDLALTEEFADSLYYLGFLLTLVSLGLVFYRLSGGESDTVELSVVLPQFGLALATTIVGLVGRTTLTLFRNVGDETEQRAQDRMTRAFDDFADALERLGQEADAFRVRTQAQLETVVTQNQQQLEATLVLNRDQLDAALALSRQHLDAAGEAIGGLAERAEPLIEAMEKSARTLEATQGRVTEEATGFDEELRMLRDAVSTTASTLRTLEERTRALDTSLGEADHAARRLTAGLEVDDGGVAADGTSRSILEEWRTRLEELASIRRELGMEADQAGLALARFRKELAGGVRVLREEVDR